MAACLVNYLHWRLVRVKYRIVGCSKTGMQDWRWLCKVCMGITEGGCACINQTNL